MINSLKVCIVGPCPPPYGGVTRLIENHLKNWVGMPIETMFLDINNPISPEVYPQTSLIAHLKKVSVVDLILAFFRVGWRLGPCSWKSFKRILIADITLRKAIQKCNFDIIYAHHTLATGLIAVTEARLAGIPGIVNAYGETWLAEASAKLWRRAIEFTVRNADWLVCTSEHCRNGAIERGGNLQRSSIIYAGIDVNRFRPGLDGKKFRLINGVPEDAIVISILGLALKRKLVTFLASLHFLMEFNNVFVLIGGTGKDQQFINEQIELIDNERIKTLGFVPEANLPEFYAATDILVVAPNTIVECMGQSMKEAMACGKVVVGAKIGGVPEALEKGNCGLMFEPDNPNDLNRVLEVLINDSKLRHDLGMNGRIEAENRFDSKKASDRMYNLLQELYHEKKGCV